VDSCTDYHTFVTPLDTAMESAAFNSLTERLRTLGVADQARMGVIYVRGPWGFLVIPSPGYPELRVSFYHDTSEHDMDDVLASIKAATVDYELAAC